MASLFSKVLSAFRLNQLRNDTAHARKQNLQIKAIELEPRVLYSATPFDVGGDSDHDNAALLGDTQANEMLVDVHESSLDLKSTEPFSFPEQVSEPTDELQGLTPETSSFGPEIVFIDSGVEGWQLMLDDLRTVSDNQSNLSIVLLDTNRDGIEQISELLSGRRDVAAIHLISHGDAGQLQLGNTTLASQNFSAYAAEIANWNDSLSDGADLLIYGCDLASNEEGRFLAESLGELCNCDVAASDDLTGHASLGGDWLLEYAVGDLTTQVVVSQDLQENWLHTLDVAVFQQGINGYTGTVDTEIDSGNANADNSTSGTLEADDSPQKQTLIRFEDLFGPGVNQIDAGAFINSATLTVNATDPTGGKIDIHEMLIDWDDTDSWNSLTGGISLDDLEASSTLTDRLTDADQTGSRTFVLSSTAIQKWADGEANYGFVIVSDSADEWAMDSSEGTITPILTIDYTAPAHDTTYLVNLETAEVQITADSGGNSVARSENGNSIVVWSSDKQDGDGFGVYAQVYDSSGARISSEIDVSTYTTKGQQNPAVAVDDAGNFVVVWESFDQDGDDFGIYAQRFDAAVKVGGEIPVNTHITKEQINPAVAMDADGDFVIVWQSFDQDGDGFGIFAQRFDSAGNTDGDEFVVNTLTSFDQIDPSVAMAANGNFVVTWTANNVPNGDGYEIIAQRFDANGNAAGVEFQVNTYLTQDQFDSSVAMNDSGQFAVVWTSTNQDGSNNGIYGRTYNADGTARTEELLIPESTMTIQGQDNASVSMQSNGDFTVTWTHSNTDLIYYREFNLDGIAHGGQIQVDTTTGLQKFSGVAVDDNGGFTIAWSGDDPSGDDKGVFARFYADDANEKPVFNGDSTPLNYAESDPATIIDSTITVNDTDSTDFNGGYFQVEFNFGGTANDRIEINHEGFAAGEIGIFGSVVRYGNVDIGTFSGGTDGMTPLVVVLNSAATPLAVEALAQNITYRNVSDGPATDARQVRFYAHDGDGHASLVFKKDIIVGIINDAPVITAPASENITEGGSIFFDVGTNDVQVNDPDIGTEELRVTLTVTDGLIKLGSTTNLTFTTGDGNDNPVMVFTGTQADVNNALDGLKVTPPGWFVGTTQLTIEISDQGAAGSGGEQIDIETIDINVASDGTNDAPKIIKPGNQNTIEDQPLFFSDANANRIQLEDDAGNLPIEVTLGINDGTISLSTTAGLTFSTGTGTADTDMVFTGTVADINAALDGMYYSPSLGFISTATLTIDVDDLGNSGGGNELDSDSLDIDVDVRNRAPDIGAPTNVTTIENTDFTFDGVNLITFSDVDAGAAELEVTLSVTHGVLTLGDPGQVSYTVGDGINDATMTFKGKLTELNAAIDSMVFSPQTGYAGAAGMTLSINDLGNTGAGGALVDSEVITVFNVTPDGTDDSPENTVPGIQATDEETPLVFSDAAGNQISINDDTGPGTVTVTLTATDGTISLSNTKGGEFKVNTDISGDQEQNQVAMSPNGNYVVVWTSAGQDGSGDGVYAQLYDATGAPTGGEFLINEHIPGDQNEPSIAIADNGDFVVVWTSNGQDGSSNGVYGRLFNADGTPASGEFLVNNTTANEQRNASVAMDADGDFVVVWQSKAQDSADNWGVYGMRFDALGNKLDAFGAPVGVKEFLINTETDDHQENPVVAMDDAGNFAVAWQSDDQDGDDYGVFAKRFSAAGQALDDPANPGNTEFQVNTVFFKDQGAPSIAMDDDGDFVIAWQSEKQDHPSGDKENSNGIYAQRFDSGGNTQGLNVLVNSTIVNGQSAPTVAMDSDGNFVIAWQATKQDHADGKEGVYGQRFDFLGTAEGNEFLINTTTAKEQEAPAIAMGDDGSFVATWQSKSQDQGDSWGVYGQLYKDVRALTFNQGDGFDDPIIEVEGTVDQINDALNGLVFTPGVDFVGNATLTVNTDDGNTTPDNDVINITVGAVNDAPTVTAPATDSVVEGETLVFSAGNGNLISVGDVDVTGPEIVEVTLLATEGTVSLAGALLGLTFTDGDGTDDASMTFTGTIADINTALDGMGFNSPETYAGNAFLQVNINDKGNVGVGQDLSASATVDITVISDATNDAPEVLVPGPQRTPVDTPIVLQEDNGTLVSIVDDSGYNNIEVTVQVTNGTVSLTQSIAAEFQINTEITDHQQHAVVAAAPNGDYVVVWQSENQDGNGFGIFAQRYNSEGQPAGAEFQVNQTTLNDQEIPVVTMNATGQFAIAWQSTNQDGSGEGIYARVIGSNGLPIADEVLVNSFTQGNQSNPSIAMDDAGNFVVVWESDLQDGNGDGVFGQRFDAAGIADGAEFQVNTLITGNQRNASVAMDADGDFVVVWQGKDTNGEGILAQRYDSDGNEVGSEFLVATVMLGNQTVPDVAMDDAGNFVVVWQSPNEDGNGESIVGRRFDNGGVPQGANFVVNTTATGNQVSPSIDMNGSGEFFVVWEATDDNALGSYGQRFDASANKVGEEVLLNTVTLGNQDQPSVAMDDNGNVITVWTGSGNQDGDGDGIFGQRLSDFGGLSYTVGDGENDNYIVVTGSLEDVNNALANMEFIPKAGFTGLATVTIDVNDLGNNGTGGPWTDSETLDIFVGGGTIVDLDADNSNGSGSSYDTNFFVGGGPVNITDSDVLIDDPANNDLDSMTITITNMMDAGEILATNTTGTSIVAGAMVGDTLTLTGPASLAEYELVLSRMTYDNTSGIPTYATRVIEVIGYVGIEASNTALANIAMPGAPNDLFPNSFSINENIDTTSGYSLGTLSADDDDIGDSFTYSIQPGGDGALFSIGGTLNNELILDDGIVDHESQPSYTVNLRVTDSFGLTYDETITVDVNDLNEAPFVVKNIDNVSVINGAPGFGINLANHFDDPEEPASDLTYTVTANTNGGLVGTSIDAITDELTLSFLGGTGFSDITVEAEDAVGLTTTQMFRVYVNPASDFWFTTSGAGDTAPEQTDGLLDWDPNEIIGFGGPGLSYMPSLSTSDTDTTTGTFSYVFDINEHTTGDEKINAMHYVTNDIDIGNSTIISLFTGDLLLSTAGNATLEWNGGSNTLNVNANDVFIFRPTTAGDYTAGEFIMLLNDFATTNVHAISLVEQNTVVGGVGFETTLDQGAFIYADEANTTDVRYFDPDDVGVTTTALSDEILLKGSDANVSEQIDALELIESTTTVSGVTLQAGWILTSVGVNDGNFGDLTELTNVAQNDIVYMDIVKSERGTPGDTDFHAYWLFDGSDVGLGANAEDIQSLTFLSAAPYDIAPDSFNLDENTDTSSGQILGTLTASDPSPAETFTFTIVPGLDSAKFSIDPGDNLVLNDGVLDHEAKSIYQVNIQVEDSSGLTYVETLTVNVNDLNEAPVITSDGGGASASLNVFENTTTVTTVVANDEDVPADTLTYNITGGADQLLFNINTSTGDLTFVSGRDFEVFTDSDFDGTYEVQVTVDDGSLLNDVQDISVTIVDSTVLDQFNLVSYSENDGPKDWADKWYELGETENPSSGRVRIVGGEVRIGGDEVSITGRGLYREADLSGASIATLSFDYHRQRLDESGGSITLAISDNGGSTWTNLKTYNLNGTDSSPLFEEFDISAYISSNTQVRFIGSGSDISSYFFLDNVQISDEAFGNSPPVITSDGGGANAVANVVENTTAVTTVTANDPDLEVPTFFVTGGNDAALFSIDPISGELSFISGPDFETNIDFDADGVYEVEVQARDGNGGADNQLISVTVTDVNEAPVITSDGGGDTANVNVAEDTTLVTTVSADDDDFPADTLNYAISGGADQGLFSIDSVSGDLTFDLAPDFENPTDSGFDNTYEVIVTVDDGNLGIDTQTILIAVTNQNDGSLLSAIESTTIDYTENDPPTQITNSIAIADIDDSDIEGAVILITGNYVDGQDVLAFVDTANIAGVWDSASGTLTLTGTDTLANYEAALQSVTFENTSDNPSILTRTVSFFVNDGDVDSNVLARDIDISPVNDRPVVGINPSLLGYATTAVAIDPFMTISDVDDTHLESATVEFRLGYIPAEDVLLFSDQLGITGSFDSSTGLLTLTGTATVADYETALRSVQYDNLAGTPTVGTVRVRINVFDGDIESTNVRRTIGIVDDEPPRASDDNGTVAEGDFVNIDLAANDSDNGNLLDLDSIVIYSGPTNGSVAINGDGTITYTHDGSETTSDSFTYTIKDDLSLESNQATVSLTITPVNDDPVISTDNLNAAENQNSAGTVIASDDDLPGDTLNWFITGAGADDSLFTITPAGVLTFSSLPNFESPGDFNGDNIYEVEVRVNDGTVDVIKTITVTVTNVNENPLVSGPIIDGTNEDDSTLIVDLLDGATDPENDTLNLSGLTLTGGDARGFSVVGNTLSIDPNAYNFLASGESRIVNYSYNIVDGNGGIAPQTASITITGVNDDPNVGPAITTSQNEDAPGFSVDLLAGSNDDDTTDSLSIINLSVVGDDSGMIVNPTSIDVDPNAYNFLAVGESRVITYSYDITDGNGGTLPQTATITIIGVNDDPNIGPAITTSQNEDAAGFSVDLLAGSTDDDTTDSLSIINLSVVGDDSGMIVNPTSIDVDPNAYNFLAVGESRVITYSYDITDGNGGTLPQTATITIIGVNDDPNIGPAITTSQNEDAAGFSVDLLAGSNDDDTTDSLSIINLSVVGDDSGMIVNPTSIDVDPSAYNFLAVGESRVITYSYDIDDGNGGILPQTATITIIGVNDDPNVGPAISVSNNEDAPGFSVDLLAGASDADTSDVLNVSGLTLSSGDDSGITIGVNSLSVDPNAYNYLAVGESEVITYNYTIIDGEGGSVAQTATITITGENDGPTVSGAVTDGGTEDNPVFAVNLLAGASDADTTDVLNVSGLILASGDDSGITIGVNSLSVDPNAYNYLAVGESAVIVYNYNIVDGESGSVAQTATITITGENDGPTVSGVVTDGGTEDDAVFAVDLLAGASDADTTDVINVSGLILGSGDDSGVTIGVNSLSIGPNAYNSLAVGESEVIVYNYNIIDGEGGSVAQTATITITGANDGPTVSGVVTGGGTEDDAVFPVDLLAGASDADTTDVLNVSGLTLASGDDSGVTIGINSLSVDPNAYNDLAVGESEVITYNYTIIDGEGGSVAQTATITITGENDGPTVSGVVTDGGTDDDAVFAVDLLAGASDADTTDVLNVSGLILASGDDSGITIGVNSLSVDPNAYNYLAVGASEVITYNYNIIDGEGGSVAQTATITITGENDGPTVSAAVTDGGTEDDAVFAVDLLAGASDADTTDVLNVSGLTLSSGDDSGVTIGVNSLSVDPNAYNSLAVGESEVIVYNYNIIDGEGGSVAQTATITITGANDGPTVSGVVTDGGSEDGAVFPVDLLAGASDADTTDVLNVSGLTLGSGDDSGVTIGVNSLSVDPNAYNSLAVGESEVIVYDYNIIDGEGGSVAQTATITITGANDGPTVSGVVTDGGTEDDAVFPVDLLAGASDSDSTDVLNVSGLTLASGDDSGVTIGVNSLSIDPNAYNSLAVGESEVIVYNYTIIDGEGGSVAQTATITITGENDGPTVSGIITDGGTEDDAMFAVDLLDGASDADTTDILNVSGLTLSSGDDSGVTIGVNSLSVDPNAYNSLAVGESEVIVYNYNIIDGEGGSVAQTATITITGENDGPTVSGVVTDGGTEDDAMFAVDLLNGASDADTTDVLNVSGLTLASGDDSGVTIGVNSLSVDPNAYNYLAVGESAVIVYNYNIIDGEGGAVAQTATITITGENDGPTVSGVVTDGGTEDDAMFAVDLLNGASDTDTTDVLNASGLTLASGDDSGVTIGVNSLSVDPNSYNYLAVGESAVIVYNYNIIDGEGGAVAQTATITITGENDGPTVSGVVTDGGTEDDAMFAVDLLDGASDADTTDVLNVSGLTLSSGDDSGITIGVNSLSVDPNAYNSLAVGESEVIVYNYNIIDGEGGSVAQTATITITGENDGPTVSGVITDGGTEDDAMFAVDLLNGASDADTTDVLNVSGLALASGDDSGVTIGVNSLSVDPNAYDSLAVGQSEVITYNFNIIDGNGGSVTQTSTLTITGLNDGPTIVAPITLVTVNEDAPDSIFDLSAVFGDIDDSALTYTVVSNTNPTLVDATIAGNFLSLDYFSNEVGTAKVVVRATDSAGDTIDHAIDITVNPVNDAPMLGNNIFLITENQTVTLGLSNLNATDIESADSSLMFNVSSVSGGQFELASAPGTAISTFAQGQLTSGQVVFVDDGDEIAPSFDVTVDDGVDSDGPHSAAINFANVNDAPIGSTDSFTSLSGENLNGSGLLVNDSDVDSSLLTAVLDSVPAHGSLTLNPDGSFVYIPDPAFDGVDSFTYLVNDGTANSDPTTVVITVLKTAPIITPPTIEPPPGGDGDDEDPDDILLPTNTSLDPLTGADVSEGRSIPIAKISFNGTSTEIESVFRANVTNAKIDDPNFVWAEAFTNDSTEAETAYRNSRTTSNELLDKAGWFWQALDQNSRQLQFEGNLPEFLLGSSAAMASTVTVGYLMWLVKGGQIMAAVMANLPAWSLIDPLPILNAMIDEDEDEDSLQSIIEQGEDELQSNS